MSINPYFSIILIALVSLTRSTDEDSDPTQKARENQTAAIASTFPVLTWLGIPRAEATEARYRQMADAGITWSIPLDSAGGVGYRKELEVAGRTGIKLLVMDQRLDSEPEKVVADFKDYPALGGYFIQDEPSASRFPHLAELVERLRKADPKHFAYVNLLPDYASLPQLGASSYEAYLNSFVEQVKPSFLSYDNYAVAGDASSRDRPNSLYFENLEIVSKKARKTGLPFWDFALTTLYRTISAPKEGQLYPGNLPPTEAEIRFQVFSSLAYGARGIQYFTYWSIGHTLDTIFTSAPVSEKGELSPTYFALKKINREISVLAPTLLKLNCVGVVHSRPFPQGVPDLQNRDYIENMVGNEILAGLFKDARQQSWMLVVNRSFKKEATTEITIPKDSSSLMELDKTSGELHNIPLDEERRFKLVLAPGDGQLLRIQR